MNKIEEKLNDYEGFVNKFKPKRTTDDCYTPPYIYDVVLKWIRMNANIEGREIVRPFYPDGDYEHYDYQPGCVVIDNPPFSILSKIVRYYQERDIYFFLFAPHLTLFSSKIKGVSYIVTDSRITYENGAIVPTDFITNLPDFAEYGIIASPSLKAAIDGIQKKVKNATKVTLPKYSYPDHLVTTSILASLLNIGIGISIPMEEMSYIRSLDAQRPLKKDIFGNGFLVSDRIAERLKAERLKAERLKAERLKAATVFELSPREQKIINSLNQHTPT